MDLNTTSRSTVVACVMASMFVLAIEATIISTAMPQIVADLGGLRLYSWVFASYLLTQTATGMVFGKLADVIGRKPVMLTGIAVFIVGSLLGGLSTTMFQLILYRLVQGVGAGAIQPVAMTIVGDLYPARERGKVQGYLGSVWVVAALLGPIAGALIVRHWSWPWVFWVGIPIGVLAAAGFSVQLKERGAGERRSIDLMGAVLFTVAVALLLVALTEAGADGARAYQALGAFLIVSVLLILQERTARDPILSLSLWRQRSIAYTNIVAVLVSMALIGLTTFLPVYVQGVLHQSPVVAGLTLTMMTLGWPIGTTIGARSFHRFSLRQLLIFGCALIPAGAVMLVFLTPASSAGIAALGALVMGFGMGLISISSVVLVQEAVEASERGSATASTIFARNLGSTLGATALGAIFNGGLTRANGGVAVDSEQLRRLLDQQGGTACIASALQSASNLTFWCVLLLSLAVLVLGFRVPHVEMRPRLPPTPVDERGAMGR